MAFVLFLDRESAHNCVRAVNNKQVSIFYIKTISFNIMYVTEHMLQCPCQSYSFMDIHLSHVFVSQLFGRTVKASIAIDNGRATEFIRRRNYTDKTKCYECGVSECLKIFCPVKLSNFILKCKINIAIASFFLSFECHHIGHRASELRMPQKHSGRKGTSEEERKEKEEKGSTTRACVCIL